MNLLFQSVTIIDPRSSHHEKIVDVLVKDGQIDTIKAGIKEPKDCQIIKGENRYLSPGLFDMQVNFRDPGFDWKEDLKSGIECAAKGGITGVLYMPTHFPMTDHKVQVEYIVNSTKDALVDIVPSGTISKQNKGEELTEMSDMSQSGAKAFTDDRNSIQNANLMKLALQYAQHFDGTIMNQPNDRTISNNGLMNEGVTSTMLGLKAIPSLAEEVMLNRDIDLLEYTGGKLHVNRISTKKSVEAIRAAKSKGLSISCDVAIHHLILDDEACQEFDSQFKVFPPLRTKDDIQALLEGLKDGTIDAICSDHCPEDVEHKVRPFEQAEFGIIGTQTLFPLACELEKELGMNTLIEVLCYQPRTILGLPTFSIEEGQKANLCYYERPSPWQFDEDSNASKSTNSPFMGRSLNTQVVGIVNGPKNSF